MKKIAIALMLVLGMAVASRAGTKITLATPFDRATGPLVVKPNESMYWVISGSFTGTAYLQKSFNGNTWDIVITTISAVANLGTRTGTITDHRRDTMYRWYGSTITAGQFMFELGDVDDLVGEVKNNKGIPIISYYDESVVFNSDVSQNGIQLTSTATTSGTSVGLTKKAYLSGTAAAIEGSLLITTTPVSGYGLSVAVSLAGADQTSWLGVAKSAASTGSVVDVYYSGFVLALTTGTVAPGDTLVTSSLVRGYLAADVTPTTGADVGVALSAGVAAGGLTKIKLR